MTEQSEIIPGPPETVGKYVIDGVLGQGAMGVVYSGRDPDIDREVAIKTVHSYLIDDDGRSEWLERFAREARAAGRVLHPNLVTVFDYLQQDGAPFLVMENVKAVTLEDRLRTSPWPDLAEVHDIAHQILKGLKAIHAEGIVHRDLKPANVMVTEDGVVKLADFGVARLSSVETTGAGMIGTPSYMSPEQFLGGAIDQRADLFACGVLLYIMITGRKPYPSLDLNELMATVQQGNAKPPLEIVPGIPVALNDLILKALEPDPDQRFPDASAMREALSDALSAQNAGLKTDSTRVKSLDANRHSAIATMLEKISLGTLAQIEKTLIGKLGPMGRVIAQRAAAGSSTTEQMVDRILLEVTDAGDRAPLRDALMKALSGSATSPVLLDRTHQALCDLLKPHLGPIAPILVKRHAKGAGSIEDLVESLCNEIGDAGERSAFQNHSRKLIE